jgi:hypothetical protein
VKVANLTVAVALILALTAAPAAALTVEQVKAKYATIFDANPQRIDGRTFFVLTVNDLPASDVLAGFVNENKMLFEYILTNGSGCVSEPAVKGAPGGPTRECVRKLARNRAFNDAVLPLLARYLGTSGIDLAGYSVAAEREKIDLDRVTNVAARFFYPDSIDEHGAINAHVCVGINGLRDLTGPRNLVLEAFVFAAVFAEMQKEKSRMRQDFLDEMETLPGLDLSSDPKVRLTRMQGAIWAHMARSRPLRRVLLSEYDRIGSCLPFRLVEETEP